jgi:hypothetical protein
MLTDGALQRITRIGCAKSTRRAGGVARRQSACAATLSARGLERATRVELCIEDGQVAFESALMFRVVVRSGLVQLRTQRSNVCFQPSIQKGGARIARGHFTLQLCTRTLRCSS